MEKITEVEYSSLKSEVSDGVVGTLSDHLGEV